MTGGLRRASEGKKWPDQAGADATSAFAAGSWAKPEILARVEALLGMQGHDPAEKALLGGLTVRWKPPENPRLLGSGSAGVNETYECILDNGIRAYHKPFSGLDATACDLYDHVDASGIPQPWQPIHEAAAWQLAKRLGGPWRRIVCPCVIREVAGRLGSLSQRSPLPVQGGTPTMSPAFRAAAFFDILAGQQDRNRGNFCTSRGGAEVSLYDHGFCFARPGDNAGAVRLAREYAGEPLTRAERNALTRLLASSDLFGMRRALAADRADAVEDRARRMLAADVLLDPDDF